MADVTLLKEKIKDSGMTINAICKKSGITRKTFYNRFKKPDYTVAEVQALQETLRLTDADVKRIFFTM